MISENEIHHIAKLARLELTDDEVKKFKVDLASILDYIEVLDGAPTDDVEPLYQTTGIVNALRPDEHRSGFKMDKELDELLIGQAPHRHDRFVKVKSVISK